MKKSKFTLVTVLTLAGLVVASPMAHASTTPAKKAKPAKVEKISARLSLSEDQRKQLTPLYEEQASKLAALKAKADLTKEQKAVEKTRLNDAFAAKVKESKILTDAQYKEWLASQTKASKTPKHTKAAAPAKT